MQTNKEIKEKEPDLTGQEFLLKNDQKHQNLLAELNSKINKWQNEKRTNKESKMEDIRKFIKNHYRTFIARMQEGISVDFIRNLLIDDSKMQEYYDKQSLCCEAQIQQSMLFLPSALIKEMRNRYITPVIYKDKEEKDKIIFIDPKNNNSLEKLKAAKFDEISVYVHGRGAFKTQLFGRLDKLKTTKEVFVVPINDNLFSSISSSVQTKPVEKCCKIINNLIENKRQENKTEKVNVKLFGSCHSIHFVSKMLRSRTGKNNRIKNANVSLTLNAPNITQNNCHIAERFANNDVENNIWKISVDNDIEGFLHPKCQTDSLLEWLEYYQRYFNNNVEIKDLRKTRPNQQNTLY